MLELLPPELHVLVLTLEVELLLANLILEVVDVCFQPGGFGGVICALIRELAQLVLELRILLSEG